MPEVTEFIVSLLRDAWGALALTLAAFVLLAMLAQVLRVASGSVLGANLWVWEAVGAAQSWAAMTNQQTRWQRVECPPQHGAWRVLKTHTRVPSLAVSPGDAFLAVGGQLLGQAQSGHEVALRIWVLGRDDRLHRSCREHRRHAGARRQERLRALASYAYGTEGGVTTNSLSPNPWGLRLALLRFVLVFGIKWSRSRRPLIAGVSGGSISAGWMSPVTGAIGVLGGGLINFAAAAGMLDWMQWRSIPKEVVERRVNDTLLKISFSARTGNGCQVRNHFPQSLSLLSALGKWETVDAVTTNSDWPAVRAFAMPLPAVEVAALVTPPEAGEGSGVIDRDSRQDVPAPPPSRPLTEAAFKIGKSSATGEAIGVDPDGHGLVTGGSRTGKTSFAYALLERLIERGEDAPGIFLVDPHVSLADAFLPSRCCAEAVNNLPEPQRSEGICRLRIITPDQPEVVPLNLLAVPDFSWAGNAIVQIGRRIWEDYWGPRMQAALLGLSRLEQKSS